MQPQQQASRPALARALNQSAHTCPRPRRITPRPADPCNRPPSAQLTKYQEQPQLLDGYLESIVQPLAALLRDHATAAGGAPPPGAAHAQAAAQQQEADAAAARVDVPAVCGVCRLLHVLVTVRGHKTVVRFFPHEAADLERALQVRRLIARRQGLTNRMPVAAMAPSSSVGRAVAETAAHRCSCCACPRHNAPTPAPRPLPRQVLLAVRAAAERGAAAPGGAAGEDSALGAWEAQGVLLLWLSILILTPFDLRTVDSSVGTEVADGSAGAAGGVTPLAARVLEVCQGYLDHPGGLGGWRALRLSAAGLPGSWGHARLGGWVRRWTWPRSGHASRCNSRKTKTHARTHAHTSLTHTHAHTHNLCTTRPRARDGRPAAGAAGDAPRHGRRARGVPSVAAGRARGGAAGQTAVPAAWSAAGEKRSGAGTREGQLFQFRTFCSVAGGWPTCECPRRPGRALAPDQTATLLSSNSKKQLFSLCTPPPHTQQALALAFKLGRRPALLPHAPRVWAQLAALWDEAEAAEGAGDGGARASAAGACLGGSSLARRLAAKLAQRLGLTLLAPRRARWRYVRQRAALLGGAAASATSAAGGAANGGGGNDGGNHGDFGGDDASDAHIEVVVEVEEILGCLLAALRDRDTAVRWCASKGAARLAGCLPADLGGDVVDSVVALFGPAGGRWD